jgi:RHS repeat-associated protein
VRDAWGNRLAGSSSERYGYAQREEDAESGLVYMRARMYDPRVGRFTQTDPLVGNRPLKNYLYGGNDPLRWTDPFGLQEGPPVERVNPYDQRKYICRCERNLFGFLFEWAGLPPNIGRNLVFPCLCGNTKEEIREFGVLYGKAVAGGSLEAMKMINPGVAVAVLAGEVSTGRTVSMEREEVGAAEAAWRFVGYTAGYAVLRYAGGKGVGSLRAQAPLKVSSIEPGEGGGESVLILNPAAATQEGISASRWFGGESEPFGRSWTRDPFRLHSRNRLGLETKNSAEFVMFAKIRPGADPTPQLAGRWGRFAGGGDEVRFQGEMNPEEALDVYLLIKPRKGLPWVRASDPTPYDPVPLIEPAPR